MAERRRRGAGWGLAAVAVLAAATLAGCQPVLEQGAALVGASRPLRAAPSHAPGVPVACMEAPASGVLAADPEDPALVWLDWGGERTDLTWPFGFRVRFTPDAEVMAADGRVVAREGQETSFGGGTITDTFEICTIEGVDSLDPVP